MKKIYTIIVSALLVLTSCSYDDSDLWKKVNEHDKRLKELEQLVSRLNTDISSIETVVAALNNGNVITGLEPLTEGNGWTITFSNNSTIEIYHGINGNNGKDAPVIGITEIEGIYYWATMTDGGEPVPITDGSGNYMAVTGQQGASGVTPRLGVDDEGYWTVDYGNGPVQIEGADGNPVKASTDGDTSLFAEVITGQSYVTFVLADGTTFSVPKVIPVVIIIEAQEEEYFKYAQERVFKVTLEGVTDRQLITAGPNFWTTSFNWDESTLTIKAPVSAAIDLGGAKEGEVSITAIGDDGVKIAKLKVRADSYEMRYLTFEDSDYKGAGGSNYWTSLIDSPQYGGPLLYGDFMNVDYKWYDEGNTYLAHQFPESSWGKVYWSGGHALSHYIETDLGKGDFSHQLSVYHQDPVTGYGGRNGSQNFCMHFGYDDGMGWTDAALPSIYFGDDQARVVDHMYVTISTYLLNCVESGNGLTAPVGPDGFVRLVATGYDEHGQEITTVVPKFEIANYERTVIDWQKWDLSQLGKVTRIEFNVEGDSDNGYGFSQPAYFAYDDVAVRFE